MADRADGRPSVGRRVGAGISSVALFAAFAVVSGALIRHPVHLVLAVLLLGGVLGGAGRHWCTGASRRWPRRRSGASPRSCSYCCPVCTSTP
ncbi:hypothetical protein [Amycolatopsis sp. cmx-4-83]|uniref:hypothetical protein n=1 Tax=Amycolatopsis sp. cmx-4-83 TaxID=2790940 RepID=UPI00397D8650